MAYKRYTKRKRYVKRRVNRRFVGRRRLVGTPTHGPMYGGKPVYYGGTPQRDFRPVPSAVSARSSMLSRQSKYSAVTRVGENTSVSAFRHGPPMSRANAMLYRNNVGRKTFYSNSSNSVLTPTGRQNTLTLGLLTSVELTDLKAALGAVTDNNAKILFGAVKQKVAIKNQTNSVGSVTLYDIVTKAYPLGTTLDTPVEAWAKGMLDMLAPGSDWNRIGSTPFQSPDFKRQFTVLKATKLSLEPGETHEHTFYRKINRIFDSTKWDGFAPTSVPGLTQFVLAVSYGAIGHEATTGDVGPTTVTYMPFRYDYIQTMQYNACLIPFSDPKMTVVNNLSAVAPANWDFLAETGDVDGDLINS